jgi:hypothetical protein
MAKRTFMSQNQNWTAQTTAAALTSATYMGIQGSTTTQIVDVLEILISGMASASTVASMEFAAASTAPTGITALAAPNHDFGMNQYITALGAVVSTYVAASTAGPQMSATVGALALNLSLNLFGGIIRWNAAPTQQITMIGNNAATGSFALYNSTAGGGASGLANAHIIYEPY